MNKRLEHDATNLTEVVNYYQTRARQFIFNGYIWTKEIIDIEGGYETSFIKDDQIFKSFYILKDNRNKGLYKKAIQCHEPIITVKDCNIIDYLSYRKKDYIIANTFIESDEYIEIQNYYGDKKANRSKCFLMNHIDEGLYILNNIGASVDAMKAYCLHPIIQNDDDLKQNWNMIKSKFNSNIIGLVMEYRNIANAYLSYRSIDDINEINLSPLEEVNQMLIADKIQNYKDFIIYHQHTHHRTKELTKYFNNWLNRLDVSHYKFNELKQQLLCIEK